MLTVTSTAEAPLTINASVDGPAIYLDNCGIIAFAKGTVQQRQRFVDVLSHGAEVIFSLTNIAELIGPQGRSQRQVREFLDSIGPHWCPAEMDPRAICEKERQGISPGESFISHDLMKQYFAARTNGFTPGSGKVIDLSKSFFTLGAVLDWISPQGASLLPTIVELDCAMIARIDGYHAEYKNRPAWLDEAFPSLPFNSAMPATFTYMNLIRNLVIEARSYRLKKGDGNDFCHAVVGAAFGSVALLDKHWKRRILNLPKPNQLARMYYEPEIDDLLSAVEAALQPRKR